MLTIQPNFSQRLHYQPSFRSEYDDTDYESHEEFSSENKDLSVLRDDLTDAMEGIKKYEEKIPSKLKNVAGALCLVGSGAVVGISTKFGWHETSKVLKKIADNPSVKKFQQNIKNIGKKISESFTKFKKTDFYKDIAKKFSEWGNSFAETKYGKKICNTFKKINESKPVVTIKSLFKKAKNVKAGQIADTTGDIVSVSTGVSTAAVGAISDKKKAQKTDDDSQNYEDNDVNDDEEDYDVVD